MKMYKSLLFLGLILTTSLASAQQFSEHSLGLRLGDGNGFGSEISYQYGLSEQNRLEIDLGWNDGDDFDGFKLTGVYQWVWNLEGNFNWYVGAGAGFGSYEYEVNIPNSPAFNEDETFLLAAGQIGIEYNFNEIPLQLSIDTRPELGFGDYNDDLEFDLALGIRYRF